MEYNFNTAVPNTDPTYVTFQEFKERFGEDGNIIVVGLKDSSLYTLEKFNRFRELNDQLDEIDGITNVISIASLQNIVKDGTNRSFKLEPLLTDELKTQEDLDQLLAKVNDLRFYRGQLLNPENGSTCSSVAISIPLTQLLQYIIFNQGFTEALPRP